MIRNLKALGLALVAVFALGATVASSASATDFFTAGAADTTLTATGGLQKFHVPGTSASFECFHLKGKGTTKEVKQSAVTAKELLYTGKKENTENIECDSALGAVTVDMNGCDYELTGTTDKEHPKGSGKFDAKIWIICPENKEIEITSKLGCNVDVPKQTPTEGGVTYTNELNATTKKWDVKIHATVTGVTFTATGGFCAFGGLPAEGNNATYDGTITVEGENSLNEPVDTTVT